MTLKIDLGEIWKSKKEGNSSKFKLIPFSCLMTQPWVINSSLFKCRLVQYVKIWFKVFFSATFFYLSSKYNVNKDKLKLTYYFVATERRNHCKRAYFMDWIAGISYCYCSFELVFCYYSRRIHSDLVAQNFIILWI